MRTRFKNYLSGAHSGRIISTGVNEFSLHGRTMDWVKFVIEVFLIRERLVILNILSAVFPNNLILKV